jgi:hypothetical protein
MAGDTQEGHMTQAFTPAPDEGHAGRELAEGTAYLVDTRDQLLREVRNLTAEQWAFSPAAERWSIAQVMEHVTAVEDLILHRIIPRLSQATAGAPDRDAAAVDAQIRRFAPDPTASEVAPGGARLSTSPDPFVPTGRWTTAESARRFEQNRAQLVEVLRTTPDLRDHVVDHRAFGPLDGYQWMLFVAAHSERHLKQIHGIRQHPQFPASA